MTAKVDTVLEIDTPEHLAFKVRVAGIARRFLAWLLDLAVRAGILLLLYLGVVAATKQLETYDIDLTGVGEGVYLVAMFAVFWLYYVVCETLSNGRSPGKAAFNLRVVRTGGLTITWRESALRNLLRGADIVVFPPYFIPIGPMVMLFDPKFRRLGDFVAGTMVIVEESTKVDRKLSVEADDELVESLPRSLPLDHEDLEALELFVRREHMSDARRKELAEIVAPEYAKRLGLPSPTDPSAFLAALWKRAQDPKRSIQR